MQLWVYCYIMYINDIKHMCPYYNTHIASNQWQLYVNKHIKYTICHLNLFSHCMLPIATHALNTCFEFFRLFSAASNVITSLHCIWTEPSCKPAVILLSDIVSCIWSAWFKRHQQLCLVRQELLLLPAVLCLNYG